MKISINNRFEHKAYGAYRYILSILGNREQNPSDFISQLELALCTGQERQYAFLTLYHIVNRIKLNYKNIKTNNEDI